LCLLLTHRDAHRAVVPGVTKGVTLMSERRANTAAPLSPAVVAAHAPQARCEIIMNSGQQCGRAVAKPGDRCILHKIVCAPALLNMLLNAAAVL